MIHIDSDYFSAGVIVVNGKVTRAAPILSYMLGWTSGRVVEYCKKKGWRYAFTH